jgi:hypothetical protein
MSQAIMGGHEAPADRLAVGGRTMSQGMFGGVALVLGVVGLAIGPEHPGAVPYLDAIAQIALGAALIAFGTALVATYGRLTARMDAATGMAETMGGTTADMFIGTAVVVLGVLALVRVVPAVLVPVAAILVGVGMLLNSVASVRVVALENTLATERSPIRLVGEELVFATASMRAVAGIASGVLGIIALGGGNDTILTLAAAIAAGTAMLLASTSLSQRVAGALFPRHA